MVKSTRFKQIPPFHINALQWTHVCPTTYKLPCNWGSLGFTDGDHKMIPDIIVKVIPPTESMFEILSFPNEKPQRCSDIDSWFITKTSSQQLSVNSHKSFSHLLVNPRCVCVCGGCLWYASWGSNSVWRPYFQCSRAGTMLAQIIVLRGLVSEAEWSQKLHLGLM